MSTPGLQSFRLKNFKAVRDSGVIRFTPLTVFIGNNGTGKSSFIEGLEMLYTTVMEGLDEALQPWRGFEHIINKAVPHELTPLSLTRGVRRYHVNPMEFDLRYRLGNRVNIRYNMEITDGSGSNDLFIKQEKLHQQGQNLPSFDFTRDDKGRVTGRYVVDEEKENIDVSLPDGISLLSLGSTRLPYDIALRSYIQNWQFLSLIPQNMGHAKPQRRAISHSKLEKDGSNIAEYLQEIKGRSPEAFNGIVSTLQLVLPYSQDLQVVITSELERSVYLQLTEENFKVPGWLLSTGTLRILALLALLHHPEPPPLIVIEEIENGLDPNSVQLIVDEIQEAVESNRTQIILTTHSSYLLDLLSLDHVVLVERVEGQPVFSRPGDNEELQQWARRFGLGTLYTSSKLGRRS